MKKISITILLCFSVVAIGLAILSHSAAGKKPTIHPPKKTPGYKLSAAFRHKLSVKASAAKTFVKKNNYNTALCFLVDMDLPSGQKRFFVYDLEKDSVLNSGLVTHGNCNQNWLDGRKYDNTIGCGCTSLGKYKVAGSYSGKFGLAFKLFGLENTNDNAYARYVVLHSHSCVPETEVENDICQSLGCPTVSPGFLKELEPLIKQSKKPLLLWIFN